MQAKTLALAQPEKLTKLGPLSFFVFWGEKENFYFKKEASIQAKQDKNKTNKKKKMKTL